jgi:hypothetical protein
MAIREIGYWSSGGGGGAGAVLFSTSITLNDEVGSQNSVGIGTLTPSSSLPKAGDLIIDAASTVAVVSNVTATEATATTQGKSGTLSEVGHDGTLTGKGTSDSPLSVKDSEDWITEVTHDTTLSGKGISGDPLKVVVSGGGMTEVVHDDTLTGKGITGNPLKVDITYDGQTLSGNGSEATPLSAKPVVDKIGTLTSLTTTNKSNVVSAINEVNAKPAGTTSWGGIRGQIANQTDLANELSGKLFAVSVVSPLMGDGTTVKPINAMNITAMIGTLANLTTTVKSNTVAAINEVNNKIGDINGVLDAINGEVI